MRQIREHPAIGETILKPVVELKKITQIVRAHHEHYDGSGYPDNLKGQEIPLGARIMAVADTYDAITSDRPYRKAASHDSRSRRSSAARGASSTPRSWSTFSRSATLSSPTRARGPL